MDFQVISINESPKKDQERWRFSTIYKDSIVEGKTLIWTIAFDGNELLMFHGFSDGIIQKNTREISPKEGRTIEEQAHLEARKRYMDKLKEGYISGESLTSDVVRSKAMLANKYIPGKTRITFPIAAQAKIDGIRMLVSGSGTSLYCMSREGNEFSNLSHIKEELRELINYLPPGCIIDGELYSTKLTFNELSGIVRKKTRDPREELITYNMFDINMGDRSPFEDRYSILYSSLKSYLVDLKENYPEKFSNVHGSINLRMLRTYVLYNENEIQEWYNYFTREKFEGIILRKLGGNRTPREIESSMYKPTRVSNILKYKGNRESEEVTIIGSTTGVGQEKGAVIWKVRDQRGNEFTVRPKGTFEERRDMFFKSDQYIGKLLTIEYQELSEYGVPRFPIGIEIRNYE